MKAMDLGDLMEYRRSNTMVPSLVQKLNKIESSSMRAACRHMLNLDPAKRLTAMEYIERLSTSPVRKGEKSGNVDGQKAVSDGSKGGNGAAGDAATTAPSAPIPPYARIALVARHYSWILKETVGVEDSWGE
eukprot:9938150-Ditylum_brightwellii.AAC.1